VLGGGSPFPDISGELLMQLQKEFELEVAELEKMLHRDLSAWKVQTAA
jgi:hypothetical protein